MSDSYGLDLRNGASRDGNEELQSTREMPKDNTNQRIECARMVHKTLSDFGDASVAGIIAISQGQVCLRPHLRGTRICTKSLKITLERL